MSHNNFKTANQLLNRGQVKGRALVTGAAGFIGSHLCERLIASGYALLGLDNFVTGRPDNLSRLWRMPRFGFVEHDVIEPLSLDLEGALGGRLDWIFHLASPASPPQYQRHSIACMRSNAEGSFHLLELARRHGAGFLLASTSEIYGDPEVHPQRESYWGNVNPIGPRAVYDEAKRYAEAMTVDFQRRFGVDTRIVRIFNTYGPRMAPDDGRVISNFITQALRGGPLTVYGDGTQTRAFQYVSDLLDGIMRLTEVATHEPINLGNPDEFTVLELAKLTRELVDARVDIVFEPLPIDDPRRRRPDISRAKQLLGWQPRVPLLDGLTRTLAYFRAQLRVPPIPRRSQAPRQGL
ncbi:UDP-glucuronic acid decarboxylase family protein [Enhygromyxa salina]|uniref:UDP-glucose 4-epimerase n=1 Tax=Enhygromyxa salina TaxID=215803 RepID=A0A2S9XTS2_9BACT|nr:UDP-glucuronic acid decarboxylase family protein [Enhygromyxa salina]PRP96252.1 UDP-glucose 4-epimerase [Enhygromyxa salina]